MLKFWPAEDRWSFFFCLQQNFVSVGYNKLLFHGRMPCEVQSVSNHATYCANSITFWGGEKWWLGINTFPSSLWEILSLCNMCSFLTRCILRNWFEGEGGGIIDQCGNIACCTLYIYIYLQQCLWKHICLNSCIIPNTQTPIETPLSYSKWYSL